MNIKKHKLERIFKSQESLEKCLSANKGNKQYMGNIVRYACKNNGHTEMLEEFLSASGTAELLHGKFNPISLITGSLGELTFQANFPKEVFFSMLKSSGNEKYRILSEIKSLDPVFYKKNVDLILSV